MILLFFAAVVNYLDRSSLSVANLTIREELGLKRHANRRAVGILSLTVLRTLPGGPLLDRKGPAHYAGAGDVLLVAVSGNVWHGTQLHPVCVGAYRDGDRRSANEPVRRKGHQRLV